MKRPTLATVADRCGVSTATVSRALSRPGFVKPEVRAKILAVAAEMGYKPNKLARGLATGRVGRVGLVVPDIANPFFTELLRSIQSAAESVSRWSTLIVSTEEVASAEPGRIADLLGEVDGVIIASPRSSTQVLRDALKGAPAVFVNKPVHGHDAVLLDYRGATDRAADLLKAKGHRKLALVRGPVASWAGNQRVAALKSWAQRTSTELVDLGSGMPTIDAGLAMVDAVLQSGATAVVAYDDMTATGVITGLQAVRVRVPEDISVLGCDDTLLARLLMPPLTTIAPPYREIAVAAVNLLSQRIANPTIPTTHMRLECTLTVRQSTGIAPKSAKVRS